MSERNTFLTVVHGLLLFLAAAASFTAASPSGGSQRTATDEALEARRAIGEVYWTHREWPSANSESKPAFSEAVSDAEILASWRTVENRRELLVSRWGIEITGEMLQTEMRRIATSSRDPARLREIYSALGNDARLIAEYLAQPLLVNRLITRAFRNDSRIHDRTRAAIDEAWMAAESLAEFRALASDDDVAQLVRRDHLGGSGAYGAARALSGDEWEAMISELRSALGVAQLREGQLSPLLENESSFYRVAIARIDGPSLTLIQKSWRKQSLESWIGEASPQAPEAAEMASIEAPPGGFTLPGLSESFAATANCTDDSWRGPLQQQPSQRFAHTAVWSGSEMIIFGGFERAPFVYGDGGRYDPVTDTWTPIETAGAPDPRGDHTAVWSGTEMLVWGGSGFEEAGGRYNPATDSWSRMTTTGAPLSRSEHVAVWSGTEMLVWGGFDGDGGRYNPATDSWSPITWTNAPEALEESTAVWTGTEMIVWGGGTDPYEGSDSGARYNPVTDVWTTLPFFPQLARIYHSAVWTGSEMIIWAGQGLEFDPDIEEEIEVPLDTGAMYSPALDQWTSIFGPNSRYRHTAVWTGSEMLIYGGEEASSIAESFHPGPEVFSDLPPSQLAVMRTDHSAVWTGTEMIVWGGVEPFVSPFGPVATGVTWTPGTSNWSAPYASLAPTARAGHTAVWTGSEMIVFGGRGAIGAFETGRRYDPALDDWSAYSHTDVPTFREFHRAVWTGTEMIVWGGRLSVWENNGGRYNPATDSWTPTTLTGAPAARGHHATAWTGSEMLVWGGGDGSLLGDGARYNPAMDSWTPMSATNAPSARDSTHFVWTGTQAFLWGGVISGGHAADGRLYDPAADTWITVSSTGAPDARGEHASVWTGSEVLLWGGDDGSAGSDTGAHYDPLTDTWAPTPALDAPSRRELHTAVWTGDEMIVWGGRLNSLDRDTGARYDPVSQVWTATSLAKVASGRYGHSAVWAGTEMLVWGGRVDNTFFNPDHGAYCASSGCTASDWYRDDDGDGVGDSSDTVSECEQPAGYTDLAGDCNDADGAVYGRPGETREMMLTHDSGSGISSIERLAPTDLGGTAGSVSYDLLRSGQASDFTAGTCLETASSLTTSSDASTPASGSAFFYLSRATNACPAEGVGSLGSDSSGGERSSSACP